jgi:GTPase SAR1 family protein
VRSPPESRQYTKGLFTEFYKSTIGVNFTKKKFVWDDQTTVNLQLWDVARRERFGTTTHVDYQEVVGFSCLLIMGGKTYRRSACLFIL